MNEELVVCVRGIISFFTLLIFTRILGKQQLGEISFFDYIVGITIGSFAATLTIDLTSAAWPHWIGLLTWIVLGVLLQKISLKSKKISVYINAEPIIVVYDGKIAGDNLKTSKFTFSELLIQLRLKDIFDINEIKFAIIETNGQLSVFSKEQFNNLINSMNITANDKKTDNSLIFNGLIIDLNLSKLNLDHQWILDQLKKQGHDSPIEVFYAYLNSSRKLKIKSYKDSIISTEDIFK